MWFSLSTGAAGSHLKWDRWGPVSARSHHGPPVCLQRVLVRYMGRQGKSAWKESGLDPLSVTEEHWIASCPGNSGCVTLRARLKELSRVLTGLPAEGMGSHGVFQALSESLSKLPPVSQQGCPCRFRCPVPLCIPPRVWGRGRSTQAAPSARCQSSLSGFEAF